MSWTDERIAQLKKCWDKGLSASQIATELGEGVTRNAVIGKAHRLGLKSRPSPVKTDAKKAKAPAAKKAAPKPKAAAKTDSSKVKHITLLELNERICKWPIGHPGEEDFHFCGESSEAGHPYCAKHCGEAYQAQAPRRARKA